MLEASLSNLEIKTSSAEAVWAATGSSRFLASDDAQRWSVHSAQFFFSHITGTSNWE